MLRAYASSVYIEHLKVTGRVNKIFIDFDFSDELSRSCSHADCVVISLFKRYFFRLCTSGVVFVEFNFEDNKGFFALSSRFPSVFVLGIAECSTDSVFRLCIKSEFFDESVVELVDQLGNQ